MIARRLLWLLLVLPRLAPAQGELDAVQRGVTVAPDTVTVGDPFLVRVRIHAPRGATVEFPEGPDTAAAVEALASRAVRQAGDTTAVDITATYRLVAWDVGAQPLGMRPVVVRLGGAELRLSLADLRVYVRSVLPADTTLHVPKPARPVIELPLPWWLWWLVGLLVAALLAALIWWLRRRLRRRPPATPVDPYALAEREFARIEALGLLEAGERGRFVALMVDVLRGYLVARAPGVHRSLTSRELLAVVRAHPTVPVERLARVLAEADLIKFARRPVGVEQARELARETRAIAREVEEADAAARAAAARDAERAPREAAA